MCYSTVFVFVFVFVTLQARCHYYNLFIHVLSFFITSSVVEVWLFSLFCFSDVENV